MNLLRPQRPPSKQLAASHIGIIPRCFFGTLHRSIAEAVMIERTLNSIDRRHHQHRAGMSDEGTRI